MKGNFLFFLLFVFFSPIACASIFPEKLPDGLVIEFGRDGGKLNLGESLRLSSKETTYSYHYRQAEVGFNFSLSQEELSQLYDLFRKNKFDRIKTDNSIMIFDEPGEYISISWGTNSYHLGTSGTMIQKKWQDEWDEIVSTLDSIIQREKEKHAIPVLLILGPSLAGRYVVLNFSNLIHFSQTIEAQGASTTLRFLPGTYEVVVQVIKDYDPQKSVPWQELQQRMIYRIYRMSSANLKQIKIGLKDSSLHFTPVTH